MSSLDMFISFLSFSDPVNEQKKCCINLSLGDMYVGGLQLTELKIVVEYWSIIDKKRRQQRERRIIFRIRKIQVHIQVLFSMTV